MELGEVQTTSLERITKIKKTRKVEADKRGAEIEDERRLTRRRAKNSRQKNEKKKEIRKSNSKCTWA